MNNFDERTQPKTVNNAVGLNSFLTKMYGWMSAAVLLSAVVAYFANASGFQVGGIGMIAMLGIWFFVPMLFMRNAVGNPTGALIGLVVFAGLTGLLFSSIFRVYTQTSIVSAFVSSASIFIVMSVYGAITHRNLDRLGTQLTAALIGIIVGSIINIFLRSSMITLVFSALSVIIFTGLTAYDTQKMKELYNQNYQNGSLTGLAIVGALTLYLDFINLFMSLLQIFGIMGGNNRN